MYAKHWGIRKSPFRTLPDSASYFATAAHEEALARLHYLVECGHRLGLLRGGAGSGKSLLLEVFAEQVRRSPHDTQVLAVSLADVSEEEFLWELAAGLGSNPPVDAAPFALWRRVVDRLDQLAALGRGLIWLGDDLDRAEPAVLKLIGRLARRECPAPLRLTLIVSLAGDRLPAEAEGLADLVDLQVELEPWTADEVHAYLTAALAREGSSNQPFAAEAAARIHELTGGVPRRVNRMAELALLAGAGLELEQFDGSAIDAVYEELDPSAVG